MDFCHTQSVVPNDNFEVFEITKLIANPYNPDQLISIGNDGFVRAWDIHNLKKIRDNKFKTSFMHGIVGYKDGYLLGLNKGDLLYIDTNFKNISEFRLHEDCITSIAVTPQVVITVSLDGKVLFLNPSTLAQQDFIQLDNPLFECIVHQDFLYIAANPSYQIHIKQKNIIPIGRFTHFIVHQNQALGCSDQNGITFLTYNSHKDNLCQYLISLDQLGIAMVNQGSLGFLQCHKQQTNKSWKIHKIKAMDENCRVLSAAYIQPYLFLAGQQGTIFQFTHQKNI